MSTPRAESQEPAPTVLAVFLAILDRLHRDFPTLRCDTDLEHPETDALATFPRQPGLDFEISINLQGDELHLNAASFWVEWFPCTDQRVADQFADAVRGLLSGEYRIVEYLASDQPVKANLQRPRGSGWKTIARYYSGPTAVIPWLRRTRIVQNSPAGPEMRGPRGPGW